MFLAPATIYDGNRRTASSSASGVCNLARFADTQWSRFSASDYVSPKTRDDTGMINPEYNDHQHERCNDFKALIASHTRGE